MAEERLIDRDKDKKYRFRKNENGEDELVIDDGLTEEDGQSEQDEVNFEVPEFDEDDEEAAVMTPEQLAARQAAAQKQKEEEEQLLASLIATAQNDAANGRFATALEAACKAEEMDGENGIIHALKLQIYTQNFTDYSQIEKAAEGAEDIKEYVSPEQKGEILAYCGVALKQNIQELNQTVAALDKENEEKKAQRAVKFNRDKKHSLIAFCCTLVPVAAVIALAIVFATMIFSSEDGTYLVLTIAFAALSIVGILVLAFLGRWLATACRRVSFNKQNISTKLGRQLIVEQNKLDAFNAIYSALQ